MFLFWLLAGWPVSALLALLVVGVRRRRAQLAGHLLVAGAVYAVPAVYFAFRLAPLFR